MAVVKVTREVSAGERLKSYVPRLVIDWLRETPDARHRPVDGSLAFVDISGFTQLTEKLARRGKVGAEEVTDTLQTIFRQLLDVAYEYDAGLLKWGGDALLLLFDGDNHARRCCRAAAGMQKTLDRIGTVRAGGARVTLRMSVGIHSGSFDFFLVGESHRELIITGPAATTTVAMESDADAGEIAVSPMTAELIGAAYARRRKGQAMLLERAPDVPADPAPEIGDVSDIDLPSCIPVELRKQLLVEQGEAEHRTVSVGFLQFSGTDDLLARAGPVAVADGLHRLVANVQKACERFGVTFFATDINADGGKIILVTGAPWSGGDDAERLLRAVRMIMDRPGKIPIRIGVNTGRAFTCDFGPTYRRTYQIYGDAVNLAARVMAKGHTGQALATDATLSRARTAYELEELQPFMVKGKSEPVHASVLGAIAGAKAVERAGTPLIGRDEEMAVLTTAADSARAGEGRLVELIGEPGIGKSRLVQELETRSQIPSFWAVCEQYESSTPYFPFRGLLHELLGIPRDAPPREVERALRKRVEAVAPSLGPWLPLLATPLGLDLPVTPETSSLDERFLPERTAEVVDDLLSSLRSEPTLLVFDDVHWLDEASVGLLTCLAERVVGRPWFLLLTRRDVDTGFAAAPAPHVSQLRPAPLTEDAAAELAKAATEDVPLPPHVLDALAERSGGNPLFLNELISAALAGASLDDLPDSVEALMAAQIDRLEPSERTVLRYAAVLGASFETELLADALYMEIPALADDLSSRLADFLGEDEPGVLRFRHALIRDAAYEGLPYRRRRVLHERVGETIERRAGAQADEQAEHLSLHFFHAHDFGKAWRYSRLAGERAAAIYANVEAAAFYERALDSVRRLRPIRAEEVGAIAEVLGDVRIRLNEFERARRAYRITRGRLGNEPVVQARLLLKEAMIPYRLGRRPQALRWFNRALRALEGDDSTDATAQRAKLFVWCAMVRADQHRLNEAIEWCERATAEAERAGARDVLAHAYHVLDWAYLALGHPEKAVYSPRAIAIHKELGDLDRLAAALNNSGMRAYLEGRWDEALDLIKRARQACEQVGDRAKASYAAMNIGDFLLDQGRLDEAEPVLRDVLRIWKAAGSHIDVAEAMSLLGRLETRAGHFEQARALLDEARALSESERDDVKVLIADVWLAECWVMQGDGISSASAVDDILRQAKERQGVSVLVATLYRLRGWILMEAGDYAEARAALEEGLRAAELPDANLPMRSTDYETALTLDALAKLGRSTGEPVEMVEGKRDDILARLGVVAIPDSPVTLLAVR